MRVQAVPTVGVEEEFVLLDRALLAPVDAADAVLRRMTAVEGLGLHMAEFFASQVELATLPTTQTDELERMIRLLRTELAVVAAEQDCIAAGTGTPFDVRDGGGFSAEPRYERIAAEYGAVARDHQINGLHVHVAVPSDDAAVRGINVLRPWLPLLLALSANSPFWRREDTGFDSWRAIHSRRWSSSGVPPRFTDADDFRARTEALAGIAGVIDPGTLNWVARPSRRYPTVEVRVFDAQFDPAKTAAFAALTRALITHVGEEPPTSGELVDAAMWHAARNGVSRDLVDPRTSKLVPAEKAVAALLDAAAAGLDAYGDRELVASAVADVLEHGNGASRQRRAFTEGGIDGLRRLYSRLT